VHAFEASNPVVISIRLGWDKVDASAGSGAMEPVSSSSAGGQQQNSKYHDIRRRAMLITKAHDAIDWEAERVHRMWQGTIGSGSKSLTGCTSATSHQGRPINASELHVPVLRTGQRILRAFVASASSQAAKDPVAHALDQIASADQRLHSGSRHLLQISFIEARQALHLSKVRANGDVWNGVMGLKTPAAETGVDDDDDGGNTMAHNQGV